MFNFYWLKFLVYFDWFMESGVVLLCISYLIDISIIVLKKVFLVIFKNSY